MSPEDRMYFPLTPAQVARLQTDRCLPAGLVGFAVDDSIRNEDPDGDVELWEFLTLQRAAAHARNAVFPIVIVAADVPSSIHGSIAGQELSATLNRPLAIADVACLHLGDDALGGDALSHSPDPVSGEHIDLSWFDISELAQVVRLLSPPQ